MIALDHVLVPTDFSEASDVALAYGRTLARTFGATLHVLHVTENAFMRAIVTDPYAMEAAAAKKLQDRITADDRRTLRAHAVLETSDDPARAIATYANAVHVGLIVMGTRGRPFREQILMGSVAERVVRTAPCPVLTVKQPEHDFVLPDRGTP